MDFKNFRKLCIDNNMPLISEKLENFFRVLFNFYYPRSIFELGTGYGYTACLFSELLPKALIYTIEHSLPSYNISQEKFKDYPNISGEFIKAENFLPFTKENSYDFIFIDGEKKQYYQYLSTIHKTNCLKLNGIIICDDMYAFPEKTKTAWEYLKLHSKWETVFIPLEKDDGISLTVRKE